MKILRIGCVLGAFLSLVLSLSAQTLTQLHNFDAGGPVSHPDASNVQIPTAYLLLQNEDFGIINLTTGAFTRTGNTGVLLAGIGVGPNGSLYGGADYGSTFYKINSHTGSLTVVGSSSVGYFAFGSTTNGVYALDKAANLYSVSTTNATTSLIGPTGLNLNSDFIWIGLSTGSSNLYCALGTGSSSTTAVLYSIDTTTGVASEIGDTGVPDLGALVFENGTLYAGSGSVSPFSIYALDPSTGLATFVTTTSAGPFWGLAPYGVGIGPHPVPCTVHGCLF
ncbi:MAG: hypothetical protein ABSD64_06805 [Terriglobales bacterium]